MIKSNQPSLRTTHNNTLVELENYKLLVDSVEDYAIFLLDPDGVISTWNKGAERNKGYKAHEIIGKHFSRFYTQEDIDDKKPERELEIAEKVGRIEDEDWRVRKDGSRFWANVIITALRGKSGELVGFAKVTRDLSERKRQEDDLRKANILLRHQRSELELLNDSKDEFISLASHQLRTPATAIKQLLGMLLEGFEGELSEQQKPFIQKAYETNDRQIAIVNSLLKVAQLDAGKVRLRKSPSDLIELLQDVLDEQTDSINARQQTLKFVPPAQPFSLDIDKKYFRMALENLIDNASKYTPSGGTITVTLDIQDETAEIGIIDTGVGIKSSDMPKLFEKFQRIPNSLSQTVSGSGLGLYWVQEVIRLHGGQIAVTSELAKGTTFTLLMPLGNHDA